MRIMTAALLVGAGIIISACGAPNDTDVGVIPPDNGEVCRVVDIEFYYAQGCDSCITVRKELFPELERCYSGVCRLVEYDVAADTNYFMLVSWLERLGIRDNAPALIVVDGCDALAGVGAIRDGLFEAIDRAMVRKMGKSACEDSSDHTSRDRDGRGLLERHVAGFTMAGIVVAALVDSFNPCMMSTLVFFLSLLSVSHLSPKKMLLAGVSFVTACYVAYFLLGLGLLEAIRALEVMEWGGRLLSGVLLLMVIVFSALSFLDAARYRRGGAGDALLLRLPASLQARIRDAVKRGLKTRNLVVGGFGAGVAVTLMESVCTGQVYVPALALMIRSGQSVSWCLLSLGLYNLIVVSPLLFLLWLTFAGLRTVRLVEWSRQNVVASKMALGLFFAALAVMMIVTR